MNKSLFIRFLLIVLFGFMVFCVGLVSIVDPYFHFHKPLSFLEYPLVNERYQNDGISRNFEYDAIVTGTSMAENCRPSLINDLFDVKCVPLCNSGGSFKEINDQLIRALSYNKDIKLVIRALDLDMLGLDENYQNKELPDYLYDNNYFNDVNYIFNKDALVSCFEVLWYTFKGYEGTTLDEFTNWMEYAEYGENVLRSQYSPSSGKVEEKEPDLAMLETLRRNVSTNVLQTAIDNPDVEFYFYLTHYSMFYFDKAYRAGELSEILLKEEMAIKTLLGYENVHIYSYLDSGRFIEDLDSYRDIIHYCEWINSDILIDMKTGDDEITSDNFSDYLLRRNSYFESFDFDSLFN